MAYKPRGPPEVEKNRQKPRRVGLCEKYHRCLIKVARVILNEVHRKKVLIRVTSVILNELYRKKVGGKGGGGKAKPKFKSYAEARKDREKFRKKLVRKLLLWMMLIN